MKKMKILIVAIIATMVFWLTISQCLAYFAEQKSASQKEKWDTYVKNGGVPEIDAYLNQNSNI